MRFTAYITEAGLPKTGLTNVTISIIKVSDKSDVTPSDDSVDEVGLGLYSFNFSDAEDDEDYVARADIASLTGSEKYVPFISESQGEISFLKDMLSGRRRITANQIIYYKADGVTVIATFNLFDANGAATMTGVYDRQVPE